MNNRGRVLFILVAIASIALATSLFQSLVGNSVVWFIGVPLMVVAVLVGFLGRSAAFTVASTFLPGLGLLGAKPGPVRALGVVFPAALLISIAWAAFAASTDLGNFASFAVNPSELRSLTMGAIVVGLVWVSLIAGTHLVTRPRGWSVGRRALGAILVSALSFSVAGSAALAARYAYDQNKLVSTVFASEDEVQSTSRPSIDGTTSDPWKDNPRINVMLLGADSADARDSSLGLRADTIMVASIDTATGDTTIVQIPRNVQYTPFPEGSELAELFPSGFKGDGDPAEFFINALWDKVENWYPDTFQGQTYPGAEGMKLGVEGITGLKIDYFALLNIDGVQRLIDAMGGVDVNINERLPIGGNTTGKSPTGWLEPGPDQHLEGYDAMWYARSRSDSSDYERMVRQSCLVDAIIKQVNPATMLSSYEAIASASADMVMTDIPQQVLEPFVGLALKVKDAEIDRLVYSPGKNGYDYNNPDFDAMRQSVQDAITGPTVNPDVTPLATSTPTIASAEPETPTPAVSDSPEPILVEGAQQVTDACAYDPVDPEDQGDGFENEDG
ncbi:MAG: LCP family glycopolymer transferase [Arachnia sp.]